VEPYQWYARMADTKLLYSLVGGGNVDKAAIFDSEGASVWASSAGFTVRL